MNTLHKTCQSVVFAAVFGGALLVAGCSSMSPKSDASPMMMGHASTLTGGQEVPPNQSQASGTSRIMVGPDKSVSGNITFSGMNATAAHIHEAAPGTNGGVIIPLSKNGDDTFAVPSGAKLTDAQYASYMSGNLYVNVHSAAYPGGEIRVQLSAQ